MNKFPALKTERLVLNTLTSDHVHEVFEHYSNEEVNKYADFENAESESDAQEIIDWGIGLHTNDAGVLWGVFNNTDGKFMGQVNIVNRASDNFTKETHRAEIGFDLSPQYWGHGYMTEAMKGAISWIFASYEIGIKRIEAIIKVDNYRAKKLVAKIGFTEEGVLRDYVEWKNEPWDMSLFSLLKKEWI